MRHILKIWCLVIFPFSLMATPLEVDIYLRRHLAMDKYMLYVTDVDPESQSFALSNKMVFQIAKKYWGVDRLPERGDEVQFYPLFRNVEKSFAKEEVGQFLCSFSNKKRCTRVWMPEESKEFCFSYVATETSWIQPPGWFNSGKYREIFELSDGSRWLAIMEGHNPFIKKNRILLSGNDQEQWVLINIDQNSWVKDSEGKAYLYYPEVKVFPLYIPEGNSFK